MFYFLSPSMVQYERRAQEIFMHGQHPFQNIFFLRNTRNFLGYFFYFFVIRPKMRKVAPIFTTEIATGRSATVNSQKIKLDEIFLPAWIKTPCHPCYTYSLHIPLSFVDMLFFIYLVSSFNIFNVNQIPFKIYHIKLNLFFTLFHILTSFALHKSKQFILYISVWWWMLTLPK